MKLDMFDIDEFIRLNHCKEVTSPVMFEYNKTYTEDGILSYEIFGYTEEERKNKFGYIDLRGNYLHPIVYNMISKRMGSLKYIITGEKYGVIKNKKIEVVPEDFPGAETGLKFIYDHFEEINWIDELEESEIDSLDKKSRLKFLRSLKKEEFFVRKWLVLPAYYREEAADRSTLGEDINKVYKNLVAMTRSLRMGFSFDIFGDQTRLKIQNTILQLYQMTMGPVTGKSLNLDTMELLGNAKNSLLKRHIIGKTIDYGALTVITAPVISDSERPDKTPIPFGTVGVTLESCLGLFKPFFIHECSNLLSDTLEEVIKVAGKSFYDIKKIDHNVFSPSNIDKLITRFIKSKEGRFDPIEVEYTDNNNEENYITISIGEATNEADAKADKFTIRPLTYVDLFYITALKITKNKHCLVTRYPVTSNKNMYPARVKVLSTSRTRKTYIKFGDSYSGIVSSKYTEYEQYPYIKYEGNPDPKPDIYYDLIGTTLLGNPVLKLIGGDYDGDTVFLRGLFSLEANEEAEQIITSKSNIIGPDGKITRSIASIGRDCTMSLYELTKD